MGAIDTIIERIEQARLRFDSHHIVKLIAVSKSVDSTAIESLYRQGQRGFGENRVQDLSRKKEELASYPLEWHFIGRLQTNKINHLLALNPSLIHSIDSFELAQAIHQRAVRENKTVRGLLQLNSAYEESKAGVDPRCAYEVYDRIIHECPSLILQGVMSIGAHTHDSLEVQKSFLLTRKIFEDLSPFSPSICSMGMSGDFEQAIECGSTMVRIGSALF